MKNYLVSRLPEFVGADGRVYNAAWGPVRGHATGCLYMGGVKVTVLDSYTIVDCQDMPHSAPQYYGDDSMVRVYDTTK